MPLLKMVSFPQAVNQPHTHCDSRQYNTHHQGKDMHHVANPRAKSQHRYLGPLANRAIFTLVHFQSFHFHTISIKNK